MWLSRGIEQNESVICQAAFSVTSLSLILSLVTWLQRGSHFPTLPPYLRLLSMSENRIFELRYASVRCHSPPPQLNITGFLWMTVLLLWSACYLLSCECFFSLIFHDRHTHTLYQHLFLLTDSRFMHSQSIMLPVHDRSSGRFVPTFAPPWELRCNHTEYVGNPFYFHTKRFASSRRTRRWHCLRSRVPAKINRRPLRSAEALIK